MKTLVKNGLIVDSDLGMEAKGNIYIENGIIVCIEEDNGIHGEKPQWEPEKTIDAQGLWVMPGFVDLHVHFREPGFEYKEDIFSGSMAAARGGFTTVCCMPNTKPVVDNSDVVKYVSEKAEKGSGINILPIGSITVGQQGESLSDIEGMAKEKNRCSEITGKGICAISEDGRSVMNAALMLKGIEEGHKQGLRVFSHTEDDSLAGTDIGEEIIVARDIMLAKKAGAPIHLCHISTEGSLEIIRQSKKAGIQVTAETCPHYFVFDENARNDDGNRKMNPPLRTPEDVEAVKKALMDGTVDVIATDHAPHSTDEKEKGYEKALNGVVGLETAFAISYTYLVRKGILTPIELVDKMSCKPAEILESKRGSLAVGNVADIAIADVTNPYIVNPDEFASKGRNTPFGGMEVYGKIMYTMVNGNVIYAAF